MDLFFRKPCCCLVRKLFCSRWEGNQSLENNYFKDLRKENYCERGIAGMLLFFGLGLIFILGTLYKALVLWLENSMVKVFVNGQLISTDNLV